jgi:hypothetical protein
MEVLGIVAAIGFSLVFTGGIVFFVRKCRKPVMKESRSNTHLNELDDVAIFSTSTR